MTTDLAARVERVTAEAVSAGALIPFQTRTETITDGPLSWSIEWASSLTRKDQAAIPKPGTKPGQFNPFLPYDPALHVADLGDAHVLLLNKFPVKFGHVLVITRAYADQEHTLTAADFGALATALSQIDGLVFFNGGVDAGASVQHRHLQIAPFRAPLIDGLLPQYDAASQSLPGLPFAHTLVRFDAPLSPEQGGTALHDAYTRCLQRSGLQAGADGKLPPYNLLATRNWFLLVPRSRETWEDGDARVSLNAMSFAGSIFVRDPDLAPRIREAGILGLLSSVTLPRT